MSRLSDLWHGIRSGFDTNKMKRDPLGSIAKIGAIYSGAVPKAAILVALIDGAIGVLGNVHVKDGKVPNVNVGAIYTGALADKAAISP